MLHENKNKLLKIKFTSENTMYILNKIFKNQCINIILIECGN